jgi:hypothetical protein
MKKSILKISLILIVLTLLLPGCLDIWFTTQVRSDGSLLQTIAFQGDSTEIATSNFAFLNEKDWKREWTKPEKDKYKLVISKEFKSVKELNKSMNPADTSLPVIRVNATLQRKFRWFFTRYVYEEKVLCANPFPHKDFRKYLTDNEIRQISLTEDQRKEEAGYDSVSFRETEKRFEDILYHSIYEDFYQTLIGVLKSDNSLTLSKTDLDNKKDIIYKFLIDSSKGNSSDEILKGLSLVLHHPDIQVIREKYLSKFDGFQNRMKFYESASDDNYKFAIKMPGLLLQTNSPKIEASETGWDLTYYDFFFKDYVMTAESRKVNTWAFIVAGLVLLVALSSLIAYFLKKW